MAKPCKYCTYGVETDYDDELWVLMGEDEVAHLECLQMYEGVEI